MPPPTTIRLRGRLAQLVARLVREGRYGSTGDVVRAGLHLLEHRERRIEALRAALIEGEQSGAPASFDLEAFIARKRRKRGCGPEPAA